MRNAKQNKKTKEKKSFKDQVMIIKLNKKKNCIIKKSVLEINFAPLKILPLKYFKERHFYFF